MNEQHFARNIRRALDESAERLPYRVTQRLERSRLAALSRARPTVAIAPLAATAGAGAGHWFEDDRPSVLYRLVSTVLPLLVVVAALFGIGVWVEAQRAAEMADIDAELLLGDDDLPVSAYADSGFGVYIRNTRQ